MSLDKMISQLQEIPGATIECKHPNESVVHKYDKSSRLGDSYWCGVCGMLLQVG